MYIRCEEFFTLFENQLWKWFLLDFFSVAEDVSNNDECIAEASGKPWFVRTSKKARNSINDSSILMKYLQKTKLGWPRNFLLLFFSIN